MFILPLLSSKVLKVSERETAAGRASEVADIRIGAALYTALHTASCVHVPAGPLRGARHPADWVVFFGGLY